FQQAMLPEKNTGLQERIKAAIGYFTKQLESVLQRIGASPVITDSRQHAKKYNENAKEIFRRVSLKKYILDGFDGQFNTEAYHRRKNKFVLPAFYVNAYAGSGENQKTENPHPELYLQLRKLRDSICAKKDLPIYFVANSKTVDEMVEYLPQTPEQLQKISGFGKSKTETYGGQFIEIIQQYCIKHNLSSRIEEKKSRRQRKSDRSEPLDTKAESFKLYKEGKSIAEIAAIRGFTTQTIEGHLSYYVQGGDIDIEKLMSRDKLLLVEPLLKHFEGGSITPIKEKLGNDISYGEIRLAIAWLMFKRKAVGDL
ncbi:MAG TPA: helix-turn-helix domain-containing protein, partial [Chitinophagaceae bacterium]|nr:helix-turn-helix domain-containing protein [Chitinophagaceae bacterium]